MKISSIVSIILILVILIIQFVLPFSYFDGNALNAFDSYENLKSIHWGFYFFFFITTVLIVGLILNILDNFDKHNFSYLFDFALWTIAFIGIIIFGWQLQYFLRDNLSLGIKEDSYTIAASLMIVIIILVGSISKLIFEYADKSDMEMRKKIPHIYDEYFVGKKMLYRDTILLNPKWTDHITHPYPLKITLTRDEIVISTNPLTIIPYKSIKEVKFDKGRLGLITTFSINQFDGRSHKIMWGQVNKTLPYNFNLTRRLYNIINEVLAGNFSIFEQITR